MKLTLVIVTSLDGRTQQEDAKLGDHLKWNSKEDSEFYKKVRDNASLIIMGSKTYEGAKHQMVHSGQKLRIVMTSNPEKYSSEKIPGMLEFTNENPKKLIKRLEKMGHKEGLLVGGAHTNTEFFKRNLVSELWQTLEPKILGEGNGIVGEEVFDVDLELISSEKLNKKGTLLLKYKVL